MRVCEEAVDLSYITTAEAELLEEATGRTDVGGVLSQLNDRVASCMMRSLCQTVPSENDGVQSAVPNSEGESIFDLGSRMGLEDNDGKGHWQYDASNASWTRFIVVPRTGFFHPSEGAAEERPSDGPKLSNLRNC